MSGRSPGLAMMTIVAVASAGLFWLLREHWGHALGLAPYLLFLACPVVHFFMHRGHRSRHHSGGQK
jgi:hypothetical protein